MGQERNIQGLAEHSNEIILPKIPQSHSPYTLPTSKSSPPFSLKTISIAAWLHP